MSRAKSSPKSPETCPYCGQMIGKGQRDQIRLAETRQRESVRAALEKEVMSDLEEEHALDLEEAAKNARREAAGAAEKEVTALKKAQDAAKRAAAKERREHEKQLKEAVATASETARKEADNEVKKLSAAKVKAERAVRQAEVNVEKRVRSAAAEAKKAATASATQETTELKSELRAASRQRGQLEKSVTDLKRQLDQRPAGELGDLQEEDLELVLRRAFPHDRIRRVGKGRAGADVLHEVMLDGDSCGIIVYESKNVKIWQKQFITKLAADKVRLGANYGILVSTAFPTGQREFCLVDDIPVVHPAHVLPLATVVREALQELKALGLSRKETGYKSEQLIGYLSSPDFTDRIKEVLTAADTLKEIQEKERRAHDRVWEQQTAHLRTIDGRTRDVRDEIRNVLAGR